jgi:DNA repair exonuclease SbcCD ATPase subunit
LKHKLRDSERQLAESSLRQKQQAARIRDFEGRLTQIESEKASLLSQSLNDIRTQEEDLASLQRKLQLANERIRIQNDTVSHHQQALEEAEKKAIDADQRAFRAERIAKTFETETDMTRGMVRDYKQAKRSEEALRYEIEHLKLDNARMVRLLSTTKEYNEFLEFAENSRGISYVPGTPKALTNKGSSRSGIKVTSNGKTVPQFDRKLVGQEYGAWGDVSVFSKVYGTGKYAEAAERKAIEPKDERDNWMPTDALHLAIDFRQRHMPHVSMELINEFLQQMNEVWRRRGVRAVARAKAKYAAQLQNYKRSNNHRMPYAEVVQKQKISQLTKELENLRRKVGVSGSRGRVSSVKVAKEQKVMQNTLFTVEKLSREVNNFAEENKKLQDELKRLQASSSQVPLPGATNENEDHDFMEGAAWFGRNSVHIMDRLGATVAQYCRDIQKQSGGKPGDRTTSALSQIEFVVNQCKTRMRRLFEGTLDAEGDMQKTNQLSIAMPLSGHRSSLGDELPRATITSGAHGDRSMKNISLSGLDESWASTK